MQTIEMLSEQAMELPVEQRLTLAHRILASMDAQEDAGAHAEWEREIRARMGRYDADPRCALTGAEVFAELDKKLGR